MQKLARYLSAMQKLAKYLSAMQKLAESILMKLILFCVVLTTAAYFTFDSARFTPVL